MRDSKLRTSLGRRLLLAILLASSLLTAVFTAFSFYLDYRAEMKSLNMMVAHVEKSAVGPLEQAVFEVNTELMGVIATGILNLPDVIKVVLEDERGNVALDLHRQQRPAEEFSAADLFEEDFQNHSWYLLNPEFKDSRIGKLTIRVNQRQIYGRLLEKAVVFFLSQGLKTIIISTIILWILRRLVTRHLFALRRFWASVDLQSEDFPEPLRLHKRDAGDEFDEMSRISNEVFRRLTKLNRRNAEVLDAQKTKAVSAAQLASLGQMGTGVAHEINNPLAIISGNNEMICRELQNEEPEKMNRKLMLHSAESINRSLSRISDITYGLLAYSRDGSRDDFEINRVADIINKVASLVRVRANKLDMDLDIIVDPVDDGLVIECREVQIAQTLINCLNNAVDAVGENPRESNWVRLSVSADDQEVRIKVANSGPRIKESVVEKVFDPFFTTKKVGKGTGLGLSICQGYVKNHGGQIYFDLTARRTTIVVRLPGKPKILMKEAG